MKLQIKPFVGIALMCATTAGFAQAPDSDAGECGVDRVCMTDAVKQRMQDEAGFQQQLRALQRQKAIADLKADIAETKKKGEKSSPGRFVPPPQFVDNRPPMPPPPAHVEPPPEHDGIVLNGVFADRVAMLSIEGITRNVGVGDQIPPGKVTKITFDSITVDRPRGEDRTYYIGW